VRNETHLVAWSDRRVSFAVRHCFCTARDLDGSDMRISPLHDWFNNLASAEGLCCSIADGEAVADPDWESRKAIIVSASTTEWINVPE